MHNQTKNPTCLQKALLTTNGNCGPLWLLRGLLQCLLHGLSSQSNALVLLSRVLREEYGGVWAVRKMWLVLVPSWQRWMNVLCWTMVGVSSTVRTHWAVTNAPVSLAMSWQLIKRAVKVSNLQIETSVYRMGTTANKEIEQSWTWFLLSLYPLCFCLFYTT